MMALVFAYGRQRFSPRVFAPVIGVLALAGWWAGAATVDTSLGFAAVAMALLIVIFRLWDDIEDREQDRRAHADRVLPQSPLAVFHGVRLALGAAIVVLLLSAGANAAVVAVGVLTVTAHLAYRYLRPHLVDVTWRYLLLLKYPACVAIVSLGTGPLRPGRLVIATLVAYAGASAYEDIHNRFAHPLSKGALS
jgi:4-hydroxybenzoate polyprenyltransferase